MSDAEILLLYFNTTRHWHLISVFRSRLCAASAGREGNCPELWLEIKLENQAKENQISVEDSLLWEGIVFYQFVFPDLYKIQCFYNKCLTKKISK